jgi:hypothetical protein
VERGTSCYVVSIKLFPTPLGNSTPHEQKGPAKHGREEELNLQYAPAPPKIDTSLRPMRPLQSAAQVREKVKTEERKGRWGLSVNVGPSFIRLSGPPGTGGHCILTISLLSVGGRRFSWLEFISSYDEMLLENS